MPVDVNTDASSPLSSDREVHAARAGSDVMEELVVMRRLQDISTRLVPEGAVHALYDQILDAAMDVMRSDMATMQMLDPQRGELRLYAYRGFDPVSASLFEWVTLDTHTTCGHALLTGRRTIVPDIEADEYTVGTPAGEALRAAGVRAAQSTPLVSRSGQTLGMLSTHWRAPYQPSERDLRLLDLLARQAADLIERAHAEARLRESEARATRVLESITDSLIVVDADWRLNYLNPACRRSFIDRGIEPNELVGKHFWNEAFPEARGSLLEREYKLAMTERASVALEYFYEPWQRWYEIRVYPIEEGGIAIYFQDVTERKKTEEALRDSEERFRIMADSSPIMIWVTDSTGQIEFVNRAYTAFFGLREKQVQGPRGWQPLVHPADVSTYVAQFFAAIRERKPFVAEGRVRHADGSWRWIASHGVPRFSASGEFLGHVGSSPDITERKRSEEALAESARQKDALYQLANRLHSTKSLEDVYDAALEAILTALQCDRASILLFDEAGVMRFTGWLGLSEGYRKAVEGHSPWKPDEPNPQPICINDVAAANLDDSLAATVRAEGIGSLAFIPLISSGRLIGKFMAYFDTAHVFSSDDLGLCLTIARQLAFGIDRRRSEEALQEADRRKDEFLATLAHELRNPLAPLLNGLHIMKLSGDDARSVGRVRSMMERQVGHMVRLIDDLLDVSRISRGKIELRKERAALGDVIQQAVETNRPLLEAGGLDLTVEIPAEPIHLEADVARLAQVVGNLLNNACKFTPKGGRIWLAAAREGRQAVIRVRDTGVGIARDQFGRIFDMFTQVDTSLERAQTGLGIGLTLVRTLTEMHGGTVEVHSAGAGLGSEFVVRLPLWVDSPRVPETEAAAGQTSAAVARRVLVVDDNGDSAESLATLLELDGHETHIANDGVEAIRAAAEFKPDLVLLDIGLPKLSGHEVARRIREEPWGRNIALVALTGWGQDNDRQKSKDVGFDSHLVKPIDPSALMKLMAEFAQRREGLR